MVGHQRVRDVLHHHRLAGLGLGDEQGALAFADGGDQVDDAAGDVLLAADVALELEALLREERRQVLEHDLVLALLGRDAVDAVDFHQREVAFAVLGDAHFAFDHVAGVQVEAADLAGGEVDVVGGRHVALVDGAQEAEAVRQHFEHAVAEHLFAALGALLHDREHQFLLAQAGHVVDLEGFAHRDQCTDVHGLQFGKMHCLFTLGCRPRLIQIASARPDCGARLVRTDSGNSGHAMWACTGRVGAVVAT